MTTGRLRALRPVWGPLSALLLYTVLRLPSFAEPHWYTDEAGYVSVASSLLRGRVLYLQIWNNKPPLHLWSIAAVVKVNTTAAHRRSGKDIGDSPQTGGPTLGLLASR